MLLFIELYPYDMSLGVVVRDGFCIASRFPQMPSVDLLVFSDDLILLTFVDAVIGDMLFESVVCERTTVENFDVSQKQVWICGG